MAQPPAYTRQYDFTDFQTAQPTTPLPGTQADAEFNAVKTTIDAVLTNLALIQRDDGAIENEVVTPDSFSTAALLLIAGGWTPRGAWATATAYAVGDVVTEAGVTYVNSVAHTSGTFSTDLAAGKWQNLTGADGADGAAGAQGPAGLTYEGAWVTATAYEVGDVVSISNALYHCLVAHTSGTFSTDLAAAKWELLLNSSTATFYSTAYTADGVATTKALPATPAAVEVIQAFHDGVRQYPTDDFTLAGSTLTWVAGAPANGTKIFIAFHANADAVLTDGSVTNTKLADMTANTLKGRKTGSTGAPEDFKVSALTEETAPAAGDFLLGEEAGGALRKFDFSSLRALPPGHISGCLPANNVTDAEHDVDFTVGKCRNDADTLDITLPALTKRFDAAFAAGTGNGGLGDTVVLPTSGTMHVFAIRKDSDGSIDYYGDTAFAGSNVPTGWTVQRRVFSFVTDGSDNIRAIAAMAMAGGGLEILLQDPPFDVNTSIGTTAVLSALSVPSGMKVNAIITAHSHSTSVAHYVSSPDVLDEAVDVGFAAAPLMTTRQDISSVAPGFRVRTNTSAQMRVRGSSAGTFMAVTLGWLDERV